MEYFNNNPDLRRSAEIKELLGQTTAYINAGGRGTRLEPVLGKNPQIGVTKALIELNKGEPIVKYHVERLLRQGFNNVVVGAGDHKNIRDYFLSNNLERDNVRVALADQQEGTGGDLIKAIREGSIPDKYVFVQNVDNLIDVDEKEVVRFHKEKNAGVTVVLTTRIGGPYKGQFLVDSEGKIIYSGETSGEYQIPKPEEGIEYAGSCTGMIVIDRNKLQNFDWKEGDGSLNLYSQVLGKLIKDGEAYAFNNGKKFVVDIGVPKTYKQILRHPILKEILDNRSK